MSRLDSLQVLRFAAALGVVHAHVALNYGAFGANPFGSVGVDLFFVLSGFIITTTARASPRGFLLKRAIRVLPPWYVWLGPWIFVAVAHGGLEWRGLLASLALWPATDVYTMPYLSVGWSLCYEAVFYAGVWLVLRGAPWWAVLGAYPLAIAGQLATGWAVFRFLGSPMIAEFLFGVVLALVPVKAPRAGAVALMAAAAAIAALAVFGTFSLHHDIIAGPPRAWLRPLVFGIPSALAVFGALQFPKVARLGRPLVFLGDASYSIYLTHLTVVAVLIVYWQQIPPWGVVAACVAFGAVAYVAAERPVLRILRELTRLKPSDHPRVVDVDRRAGVGERGAERAAPIDQQRVVLGQHVAPEMGGPEAGG